MRALTDSDLLFMDGEHDNESAITWIWDLNSQYSYGLNNYKLRTII